MSISLENKRREQNTKFTTQKQYLRRKINWIYWTLRLWWRKKRIHTPSVFACLLHYTFKAKTFFRHFCQLKKKIKNWFSPLVSYTHTIFSVLCRSIFGSNYSYKVFWEVSASFAHLDLGVMLKHEISPQFEAVCTLEQVSFKDLSILDAYILPSILPAVRSTPITWGCHHRALLILGLLICKWSGINQFLSSTW